METEEDLFDDDVADVVDLDDADVVDVVDDVADNDDVDDDVYPVVRPVASGGESDGDGGGAEHHQLLQLHRSDFTRTGQPRLKP